MNEARCKELVLEHWGLLERLSRRRFKDANLADQALLYVQEQLEADNWLRVRAYQEQAPFPRFLAMLAARLLEDFARSRFGRVRPPQWIRRLDSIHEAAFKLLCLERLSPTDAVECLVLSASGGRDRELVKQCVAEILARVPDCGKSTPREVSATNPGVEAEMDDAAVSQKPAGRPEMDYETRRRKAATQALAALLGLAEGQTDLDAVSDTLERQIEHLRETLHLDAEERLLLRMIYHDGMNASAAGRMLGMNANQVQGRRRRLLERIKKAIEDTGLDTLLHAATREE